jgi:hypothetical protein
VEKLKELFKLFGFFVLGSVLSWLLHNAKIIKPQFDGTAEKICSGSKIMGSDPELHKPCIVISSILVVKGKKSCIKSLNKIFDMILGNADDIGWVVCTDLANSAKSLGIEVKE